MQLVLNQSAELSYKGPWLLTLKAKVMMKKMLSCFAKIVEPLTQGDTNFGCCSSYHNRNTSVCAFTTFMGHLMHEVRLKFYLMNTKICSPDHRHPADSDLDSPHVLRCQRLSDQFNRNAPKNWNIPDLVSAPCFKEGSTLTWQRKLQNLYSCT